MYYILILYDIKKIYSQVLIQYKLLLYIVINISVNLFLIMKKKLF